MVEAVRAVPGVASAGLVNIIPLSDGQTNPVHFEKATGRADELTNVETRTVTPDYFTTLEIPLLTGRGLIGTGLGDIIEQVRAAISDGRARERAI